MAMFGTAENVRNLLGMSIGAMGVIIGIKCEDLGELDVKRGILQGDSFSPLCLFLNYTYVIGS